MIKSGTKLDSQQNPQSKEKELSGYQVVMGFYNILYSDKFKYASPYTVGEAVCYLNCFCFNFKVV